MDKISIKNLVPDTKIGDSKSSILDINSMITINNCMEDSIRTFSADYLIKTSKEKREKLLKIYNKYYAHCIEKIKLFHNAGKFDLIYDVPDKVTENLDYIPKYCMDFIEFKLKENYMDTYRLDYKTVFITWKYIESSKK
jgi:hypothetical protein